MVQALESDGHVPHLVWLNKSLDVPLIPNLPDDAPIVCHGQGFVTRAPHHPRLKAGLFFDPETFPWEAFRSGWGEAILSSHGRVMALSDARDFLQNGATAFVRLIRIPNFSKAQSMMRFASKRLRSNQRSPVRLRSLSLRRLISKPNGDSLS
jgi:hypothetical protein